jgi:methylated-DNA-protein-cysteine methyltransferase-like protein
MRQAEGLISGPRAFELGVPMQPKHSQDTGRKGDVPGFFERVYHVTRLIPSGKVATYGQIAAIVSSRQAARTVGWALHALDEGTDVPWHRVINARGSVSLSNRGQAAATQQSLLEAEGIRFGSHGRLNMQRYQWPGLDWPEIESLRRQWNQNPPRPDGSGG